jgi:hypothetical protein
VANITGKPRNILLGKLIISSKNHKLLQRLLQASSRDSLVCRMTGYEMDNPGFESRQIRVSFLRNVQTNLAPVSAITEKCSVFTVRSLLKLVGQDTRQNCRQSEKLSGSSSPSSPPIKLYKKFHIPESSDNKKKYTL